MRGGASHALFALALAACACAPGLAEQKTQVGAFDAVLVEAQGVELAPSPGVADESGGGLFLSPAGEVQRLRLDGTRAPLAPHPGNPVAVGAVRWLRPLLPHTALVGAQGGLFLAQDGWLIAPPWRSALDVEGVAAVAAAPDGTVWMAHGEGLFRLRDGALSELRLEDASVTGVTALAWAPAADGANGLWFLRGEELRVLVQLGPDRFVARPAPASLQQVRALASLTPSPSAPGQLWVATAGSLFQLTDSAWTAHDLGGGADQLLGAGRVLWARVGSRLLRYEAASVSGAEGADAPALAANLWQEAGGFSASAETPPALLAVDASGAAWVHDGQKVLCATRGRVPRLSGLDDGMRVSSEGVRVQARFSPGAAPSSVVYRLQDGEALVSAAPFFSLGGEEHGAPRAFSLLGLSEGLQTLQATATFADGALSRRTLTFEYRPTTTERVSFEKDVQPINAQRCLKCHERGPGRPLLGLAAWTANAQLIAAALRDQRMPADGPMDPALALTLQRWIAGGMQP